MSNDETLDLDHVREQLEQDRERLHARIDRLTAEADDESWAQPKPDEADQGSAAVERERLRNLASQARNSLRDIDAALTRIAEGRFGKCRDCGTDIPAARLEARPEAEYCVTCQQKQR